MNITRLTFLASFASSAALLHSFLPSGFPSDAIGSRRTALPSGMGFFDYKLGLPLGHAVTITESVFGMEITHGSSYILATPVTGATLSVHSFRSRLFCQANNATLLGAIFACTSARLNGATAGSTCQRWRLSPSRLQKARTRTERLWFFGPSTMGWVVWIAALFAMAYFFAFHACIIALLFDTVKLPIAELDERYCEEAANRLAQEVFAFEVEAA